MTPLLEGVETVLMQEARQLAAKQQQQWLSPLHLVRRPDKLGRKIEQEDRATCERTWKRILAQDLQPATDH